MGLFRLEVHIPKRYDMHIQRRRLKNYAYYFRHNLTTENQVSTYDTIHYLISEYIRSEAG